MKKPCEHRCGSHAPQRVSLAAAPELLIALTGYGHKEDRVKSDEAGFQHHFVKPADPREIQTAIAGWAGEGAAEPQQSTG